MKCKQFHFKYFAVKERIEEDLGYLCGGIAVQGMRLQSMNCAQGGNGFVCEMPGMKILVQEYVLASPILQFEIS